MYEILGYPVDCAVRRETIRNRHFIVQELVACVLGDRGSSASMSDDLVNDGPGRVGGRDI
jgi:hypothetical protein